MAAAKSERFELRVEEDQIGHIDAWARNQPDRPSRAEAVRRLVTAGLSAEGGRSVHFSDGEKLILLALRDLSKALKPKNPETDLDFLADVIFGGHYWAPKWRMPGVFHDHTDNVDDLDYVLDVLDMWMFIEEAYERMSADEKASIQTQTGYSSIEFPGFDGNNESAQRSIARFLIEKLERFTLFKDRDLNSHCRTVHRYSRMISTFTPMRENYRGHLTLSQLVTLLKI